MTTEEVQIRPMTAADYEAVFDMWQSISGFGIRSVDDSKENILRFLERNPGLSVVAVHNERIVGSILCGHDGRRGGFYHVCVRKEYRKLGIGQWMVSHCKEALHKEGVNKINLIAFRSNMAGNSFWKSLKWLKREDCNYYECNLNEDNITRFIP